MTDFERYLEAENLSKDEIIKGLRHNALVLQNIINELNTQLANKTLGRVTPPMFKGVGEGMDNE